MNEKHNSVSNVMGDEFKRSNISQLNQTFNIKNTFNKSFGNSQNIKNGYISLQSR